MHIWFGKDQEAVLVAGPVRPHVFGARLYLRIGSGVREIDGVDQPTGTVSFKIPQMDVAEVLARRAFLFLTTRHVLHVGSVDLRWGWRYQIRQGNRTLQATDGDGVALRRDDEDFYVSALEPFDEPVELSRVAILISE